MLTNVASGLGSADCSGTCLAGYFCPPGSTSPASLPCGNVTYYCPAGVQRRHLVDPAFYTTGTMSVSAEVTGDTIETRDNSATGGLNDQFFRSAQLPCEPGFYCLDGIRRRCPAGTIGETSHLSTANCSAECPPGYYCEEGSTRPTPCPAGRYGGEKGLV